jgi:hypothetical protein
MAVLVVSLKAVLAVRVRSAVLLQLQALLRAVAVAVDSALPPVVVQQVRFALLTRKE